MLLHFRTPLGLGSGLRYTVALPVKLSAVFFCHDESSVTIGVEEGGGEGAGRF